MTAAQYRDAIARLELSQVGAARFLCADPRTSRRWAKNGPPELEAKFLRYLLATKATPEQVERALARR